MKRRMKRHAVIQPLDPSYRLIALTQGQNAVVDAADFDWLDQYNWCAVYIKKRRKFYAVRRDGDQVVLMHCAILDVDQDVDHADTDTLNNRRCNLREATRSNNVANRKKPSNNTSGFKGAFFHKKRGYWYSTICVNQREIYLGSCGTKEEAARLYDSAALRHFGPFARLNFPHPSLSN